jgi:hypothetical protein
MTQVPDTFYDASGRYSGMSKQEFLRRAYELAYSYPGAVTPQFRHNLIELDKMYKFASKLRNDWEDAKRHGATNTGGGGTGGGGGTDTNGGTTPIAEDQSKQQPPQSTNYMTYGFIALIAVLVIVIIIVLRRK